MGMISEALAGEISRKLTSKNFGPKESALMDKIKEVFVERTKAYMGKELWDAFTNEPKFFQSVSSVYISPNDKEYQKFFPEGDKTHEIHPSIYFEVLIYNFTQDRIVLNKTRKELKPCVI